MLKLENLNYIQITQIDLRAQDAVAKTARSG